MTKTRRSPLKTLCARLTVAAFTASLALPSWAQVAVRAVPAVSAAGPAGVAGAGFDAAAMSAPSGLAPISALSAAPLSGPSVLSAAPAPAAALSAAALSPAALPASLPAAAALVPASAPAAARAQAPTAAAALNSAAVGAAALSRPGVTGDQARTSGANTFDAAAARPSDADAVPAFSDLAAPSALAGAPSGNSGELRRRANDLDSALIKTAKAGQLMTAEEIEAVAVKNGERGTLAKHLIAILVKDGRLMSLAGGRYVYTDFSERFDASYPDEDVNRAGALAKEAVGLINGSERLSVHAGAVVKFADALKLLKAHGDSAAPEVEILYRNSLHELLRDVLREYIDKVGEKAQTDPKFEEPRARAVAAHNLMNGLHWGAGLPAPVIDEDTRAWLEDLIGDMKPSAKFAGTDEGKAIGKAMGALFASLTAEDAAPADKAPLMLPAPAADGSTPAAKKPDFKPLDKDEYKNLYDFGSDITQKAADGKLRPMIGRRAELRQMVKTLLRVEKNNPLVIGEKGVGKTAIINGLAQMIVAGEIPELKGKNIVKIDLNKVVAGTKYRGEFEERMQKIIEEAKASKGRVILFIDEIHTIVGAGGASGSADASQILKESLSDGSLSLIGATTMDEFRRIEKDGALMRRFNPVKLLPPTKDEAEAIVEGVKGVYEKKHGVTIGNETVKAVVALAARYVTDRHLPDSALDLMDDASAEVELKADEAKAKGIENPTRAVTPEDIAQEISMRTGIPAGKLNEDKKTALKGLPAELKGQVIGQDEAVEKVAEAVQAGETGYRDPKQPIASFVFLGPTGVGKTELARALAKIKFGSEKNMLRLDMSEYQEKHSVSRLISAPPGYVGHDEGGQLTESIRRNPYQVILLDEIEKAHPDVFDVLLQVLEDGRLTDGQGRTVDFSNTIIIMTSNIGGSLVSGQLDENGKTADGFRDGGDGYLYKQDGIGFNAKEIRVKKGELSASPERKAKYVDEFKKKYRPEFVNRVGEDRVIVFNEISDRAKLGAILDLRLKALESQLKDKGLTVTLTDAAREAVLAKALAQSQYGARPIKQIVDREINRALKDAELEGRISDGDAVIVDWDADAGRYRADKAR